MSIQTVYAIVKASGRQEKISVDDIVVVDKPVGKIGDEATFAPVMLMDGNKVTTSTADPTKFSVIAEIVGDEKGPKTNILKLKNKTGLRECQGHRAQLMAVKVIAIKQPPRY